MNNDQNYRKDSVLKEIKIINVGIDDEKKEFK